MKKVWMIALSAVLVAAIAASGVYFVTSQEKADVDAPQPIIFKESETYAAYDAPESWQTSFTAIHDSLTVNVDAKVITPDVDRYPVYRVGKKSFTDAEMQQMVEVLMQGKEVTNMYLGTVRIKPEIQEELDRVLTNLTDPDSNLNTALNQDTKEYKNSVQAQWDLVATLQEELKTAPETRPVTVWDGTVDRNDPVLVRPGEHVSVERYKDDVQYTFQYENFYEHSWSDIFYRVVDPHMNVFGKVTDWTDTMTGSVTTQAQAIEIGDKLLESMGLTGMKLEYAGAIPYGDPQVNDTSLTFETLPRAHSLYYTRYIDGIPVSLVNNHDNNPASGKRAFNAFFEEQLRIDLTDEGVHWFQYETPLEIKEKMAENIPLLPFDQVCQQFTKYMQTATHYGIDAMNGVVSTTINIDKISLGFAYVPVPNNDSERYLVPTWEFYGTSLVKYTDEWSDPNWNENNEGYNDTLYRSYMSINAYDGSVVDHYAATHVIS